MPKTAVAYRITDQQRNMVRALAADMGISQTGVVGLAIKEMWERHGSDKMLRAVEQEGEKN